MRSSVNKLPSGRFRARYLDPESDSWISQTFDRQTDAKDWVAGIRTAREAGIWVDPRKSRLTFAEWGDIFWPIQVGYKPKTLGQQQGLYRRELVPAWGSTPLDKITAVGVAQWAAGMRGRLSASTIHSTYWLFHRMMRDAQEAKYLAKLPFPRRAPLEKPQPKYVLIPSTKEIRLLADAIPARYNALVYVMAYGGLRIGEVCALRVDDVDFKQGTIRVDESVSDVNGYLTFERPKTTRSIRVVPLPWTVMNTLASHLMAFVPERANARSLVFTSPEGHTLRANSFGKRQFPTACAAAGLHLSPHDLRHTAISTWIAAGADALSVAQWAGHTSVATVYRVYGHLLPHREDAVRDRLDAALSADAGSDAALPGTVIPIRQSGVKEA